MRNSNISLERAWYTWSERPLEMVFLPLGARITPLAYAGSIGKTTLFPSVRFGRHTIDGSLVEAETTHANTELAWTYTKPNPFTIQGAWKTLEHGEWGLRFWLNLCLSAEDGTIATFDPTTKTAMLKIGHRFLALASAIPPVQVTGHETIEAAVGDYETNGYFDTRTRSLAAKILMLRFNLEMMPENRFAAAVADTREKAIEAALAACTDPPRTPETLPSQTGRNAKNLDAIRDVMAWNTVWDPINNRPYTSISRNWNLAKFGGSGVWLNDQFFHALLTSLIDRSATQDNLETALAGATPQGNLACLITARDAWVDRTQPPIGAFILRLIHLRLNQRDMLERAYPILARSHDWWWQNRDPYTTKLCSYGTSNVGEALYQGTALGARNESCMDNSPVHDEAIFDPTTSCLSTIDVGLNSLLALDAEMLAAIATELGNPADATKYTEIANRTRALVRETLWDDKRKIFANRLRSGAFVKSLAPTSFYPLIAGIATEPQTEAILVHLADPQMFGGEFILPSVARADPAYKDNTYWRGRVWPPLNFFVWQGLRRYGYTDLASNLARSSLDLFHRAWAERRLCPENYNAETGEALDQPDTEGFYSWGALMPLLGVSEIMDLSPWSGWTLVNTGEDAALENIETPLGRASITVSAGKLTVLVGKIPLLETTQRGSLQNILWQKGAISMTIPPTAGDICFPWIPPENISAILIDDSRAEYQCCVQGINLTLPPSQSKRRLIVHRRIT